MYNWIAFIYFIMIPASIMAYHKFEEVCKYLQIENILKSKLRFINSLIHMQLDLNNVQSFLSVIRTFMNSNFRKEVGS